MCGAPSRSGTLAPKTTPKVAISGCSGLRSGYGRPGRSLLAAEHPSVFDEIGPDTLDKIPGLNWPANRNFGREDLHDPAEMGIALQYVDEFVAQSDVYPLGQ